MRQAGITRVGRHSDHFVAWHGNARTMMDASPDTTHCSTFSGVLDGFFGASVKGEVGERGVGVQNEFGSHVGWREPSSRAAFRLMIYPCRRSEVRSCELLLFFGL